MHLALDGDGPLHAQAYRALRAAILAGRLRPGDALAPTRVLAADLGVSRNTVLRAYEQLLAEGYLTSRVGSGTRVADALPARALRSGGAPAKPATTAAQLSALGRRVARSMPPERVSWSIPREPLPYDFRYGEPAYADLPLAAWTQALGRRARLASVRQLAYQPPGGAAELREALAEYLARARGVACAPEQVVVVHGSQQAIDLALRALVDPGDRVAVEEPHYTGFSLAATAHGAEVVAVHTDADGVDVAALGEHADVRLAFVTPSHQFPSGGVLSLARRLALLEWARARKAWIFEDDYDGEYRFTGRPLECLQALDREGRVLYAGTASKLLFPALRLGWLVVPESLVGPVRALKAICDTGSATLEQLAFADFVRGGHLERHVRRSRSKHAARRQALLAAIARELGERAEAVGTDAGLHVLLRIPELAARDVSRLRAASRARGVGVYPAAPFYAKPPPRAELLLGYASLGERAIREGIARLRKALDDVASGRR